MSEDIASQLRCCVCGSRQWHACHPTTLQTWCLEHWLASLQKKQESGT